VIWFVSGIFCAMTVTANRVFMVSIRREVRGRAYGIAVTGIVVAQGTFSLLTGIVANYTGPARAVADLALPCFALIVVFSVASAGYSNPPNRPIPEEEHVDHEDRAMLAMPRRPEKRAWLLIVAIIAVLAIASPAIRGDHTYAQIHLPLWWLFLVFVVGQAYPLSFSVRSHSFQVVLETVPLVLGLFFVSPLELIALRVAAVLVVDVLIDRLPPVKVVFNSASIGLATLVASQILRALAPAGNGLHPGSWPAAFAGVLASEVFCGLLVIAVLSLTATGGQIPEASRVIGFGVLVSVVMTFLALFTAAALEYDVATAWAISVFVVLALTATQTYHRLIERAAALDRLYVVARELGPTASEPTDLAPALVQLRQVMKARSLELAVASTAEADFATIVTVVLSPNHLDTVSVEEKPVVGGLAQLLAAPEHDRRWTTLRRPTSALRRKPDKISAAVRAGEHQVAVLTAVDALGQKAQFDRSDLRLLEAAADQLAAALEKGRLVESLRRAATLDTLTGLANLDSFRSFLDTTLDGAAGGVLILLNLDRFREVNDMLGHEAGDAVLAEVARRLVSSPTQGSLVARVGGDQFAIAIPGAAGSEVARLAAMAVKSRVDGSIRFSEVSADVRVTIGIARAPDHGSDAATLLRRAEMAMAAAKGSTSGIGEWEPGYERDGSRRLQLLTGLRAALGDGSLRVEYQPKLTLGSGEISGFEALVRWTHPELGPISPGEFVPIAEATGLISALTSTVLRQALAACRAWHDAGKPVGVAVNVSARSLDDSVIGQVAAMLTASGIEPRWLTLEITESSVMEDHSRSIEVLRELRTLGVRLSIDDFGTGYSSLHQLRGLPVHEVKIDRSFVNNVDTDEADRAVVRAVVELCDSLGLATVAEGVEKASQAFALEALGVGYVQGYFHGRPMPETAAMDWLMHRRVASLATI
jgi:diguanylate cyclase (GGDEF)-like protein